MVRTLYRPLSGKPASAMMGMDAMTDPYIPLELEQGHVRPDLFCGEAFFFVISVTFLSQPCLYK